MVQQITSITTSVNQLMELVLDNGEIVEFHLYYSDRMRAWFYDITYKDTTCKCNKVVLTPNSLRQFRRVLPFGIAFMSDSVVEPFRQDDFVNGNVTMYVLNDEEVEQVEKDFFNK